MQSGTRPQQVSFEISCLQLPKKITVESNQSVYLPVCLTFRTFVYHRPSPTAALSLDKKHMLFPPQAGESLAVR